ncbi:MAG: hypothetical protein LBU22_05010 [Dysgonamonadaceae bacterium]|jgi:hypothetical protein|nr:hypothetical protein [Dysgonamonadaceae bacterium]
MEENYYQPQVSLPNSTLILVFGILAIPACCFYGFGIVFAIIALVLAKSSVEQYLVSPEKFSENSYSNIKAGKICAWIGLSLSAVYLILIIAFIVIFGFAAITDPTIISNYFENLSSV